MKKIFIIIGLLLFISTSLKASEQEYDHGNDIKFSPEFTKFMNEMNEGMAKMMRDMDSPSYTGNPDIDFLSMMIPHHEGVIEMARLLLIYGTDPIVRKLAEDIIATQRVEIETMKKRLEILKRGAEKDPGGFPALGGTRGK